MTDPTEPVRQTLTLDPSLIAGAIVLVIAAVGSGIVQVIAAWGAAKERILSATQRQLVLAQTTSLKEQTNAQDQKLESIRTITEGAAKNVNGNLTAVREDLARQQAHSKSLQETIDSLVEIIKAQRIRMRSTDIAPTIIQVPVPVPPAAPVSAAPSATTNGTTEPASQPATSSP